ncbi:MAG: Rieske 2Fe-2S domain-containing protein [Alphaproteobacteria bacterium]|nr:Rieske 2Fe-2S domain-containing protein [Alphaproteobacteria bacterium]
MQVPADPFDPKHFEAVRRPLDEASTMPPWVYTSDEFYRREVDRIFMKVWNFMGHIDQVSKSGDYVALEFAGVPFIICRDEAGTLRAFANSCRHRGSKVAIGSGNTKEFMCPYHGWCYSLKGALTATVDMDATKNFQQSDYGLIPINVDTWGGFIFVNFDPSCESLQSYLGDLPDNLASHRLENMANTRTVEFELNHNWKLFVENAKESYHIAVVHRETINQVASVYSADYTVSDTAGQYCTTYCNHDGSMALLKEDKGFPKIESLEGRYQTGTYAPMIYPMTYLACTIDTAWFLQLFPMGPDKTKLIHGACFPKDRLDRPDFEEVAANYYKRWDRTIMEDIEAGDHQQVGIASPFAQSGRFCFREPLVHQIDNWVLDKVLD